jgi:HlyD family secretion protein
VWVLTDGQPAAIGVTVGRTNGHLTEITGGDLEEGQHVITDSARSGS